MRRGRFTPRSAADKLPATDVVKMQAAVSGAWKPAAPYFQASASALSAWRLALAGMRAGVVDPKVVLFGNSLTSGQHAGWTAADRIRSPAPALARALTAAGIPAWSDSQWGNPGALALSGLKTWDTRVGAATNWSLTTAATGGSWIRAWTTPTAGQVIDFTPASSVTGFRIHAHTSSGSRVISWAIDGGAATNIDTNGSNAMVAYDVAAGALGAHTLRISKVSGGGSFIWGIEPLDSTTKRVTVTPWGIAGARVSAAMGDTNVYDSLPMLRYYAPHLTVISIPTNEWAINPPRTVAEFQADLATLITNAALSGSVLVMTDVPSQVTAHTAEEQQSFVDAAVATALANGAAVFDSWRYFGSYEALPSLYSDSVHVNQIGTEWWFGTGLASLLTA